MFPIRRYSLRFSLVHTFQTGPNVLWGTLPKRIRNSFLEMFFLFWVELRQNSWGTRWLTMYMGTVPFGNILILNTSALSFLSPCSDMGEFYPWKGICLWTMNLWQLWRFWYSLTFSHVTIRWSWGPQRTGTWPVPARLSQSPIVPEAVTSPSECPTGDS